MKTLKSVLILLVTLKTLVLSAHVGHDQPAVLKPQKGGIIKPATNNNVEVVLKDKKLIFYIYDKSMKPSELTDIQFEVFATNPKTKKAENLMLTQVNNTYEAMYDSKGIHRYNLNISLFNKKTNVTDEIVVVIEPK